MRLGEFVAVGVGEDAVVVVVVAVENDARVGFDGGVMSWLGWKVQTWYHVAAVVAAIVDYSDAVVAVAGVDSK